MIDAPPTLNDFVTVTKAFEYLIAVVFLVVFPVFWWLLREQE